MIKLSYNLSPILRDSLRKIEALRQKIVLTPLSPRDELPLRWEANLEKIYWSLVLNKNPLSKHEMVKLITANTKKRLNPNQSQIVNYKKGLDFIHQNWLVNDKLITPKTIIKLHRISCRGDTNFSEHELKTLLDYIQLNRESPVIQAAIAQIELQGDDLFGQDSIPLSHLVAQLILYKHGYDFRGLLVLEEYWRRDYKTYEEIRDEAVKTRNLTLWLTYFSKAMISQLEKVIQDLTYPHSNLDLPSGFWQLNDRQKEILSILDEPKKTITNRDLSKRFKVSQITASRDLSHLAALGLLFAHGKGRSTRYTKV